MGEHVRFTLDTGVQVYFCDPRSPWQRATNENSNGLLRQYFPKGTDLSGYNQARLDEIAAIVKGAVRLCGSTYCIVFSVEGERLHIAAHHGVSAAGLEEIRRR